jgi:hypothetical protein
MLHIPTLTWTPDVGTTSMPGMNVASTPTSKPAPSPIPSTAPNWGHTKLEGRRPSSSTIVVLAPIWSNWFIRAMRPGISPSLRPPALSEISAPEPRAPGNMTAGRWLASHSGV